MQTEVIWNEFRAELLGFLKARVKDPSIAEDLLQEIFIKIHLKLDSLKNSDRLVSWLYQITRNTLIDYYRKESRNNSSELSDIYLEEEMFDSMDGFSSCLKSFIPHLDQKDQDVLLKTSIGDMSQKEYANHSKLSYTATKSRVQRARLKLKELFIECCDVKTDGYGNVVSSKDEDCSC